HDTSPAASSTLSAKARSRDTDRRNCAGFGPSSASRETWGSTWPESRPSSSCARRWTSSTAGSVPRPPSSENTWTTRERPKAMPDLAITNARRHAARRRIARAAATWGGLAVFTIVALAALTIWHLIRRGRLIREGLGPPRVVHLPDLERNE